MKIYDYVCKSCNTPFQHRKPDKVYCSKKCYFVAIAETWKVERSCVGCGEKYIPSHKKQEYCGHKCHGKVAGLSRKNSIKINCNRCGKEFERRASAVNKENYCSWECRKVPSTKTCEACGKEYKVGSSHWQTSRFCSRSCAKSGENHHFYGKHPEMPQGYEPWTKGKTAKDDPEIADLGRKISFTQKEQFKLGIRSNVGSRNPNWKNGQGVSVIHAIVRQLQAYKEWRLAVFKRDNFICVQCGDASRDINADHIKRFSDIMNENNIATTEQAEACKELWDINNGRTLCIECHKKTETYGNKKRKQ
jgi:hypothetical protein